MRARGARILRSAAIRKAAPPIKQADRASYSEDHDFGCLDESGGRLTGLEIHLAGGACRDDRSDLLMADRNHHLRHQTAYAHAFNPSNQLISPAHPTHQEGPLRSRFCCRPEQQPVDFTLRNAMVSSCRSDAADFPLVNPLFDGWEADAKFEGRFSRLEQLLGHPCPASRLAIPGHSGRNPTANTKARSMKPEPAAPLGRMTENSFIAASYSTQQLLVIYTFLVFHDIACGEQKRKANAQD